MSIFVGLNFNFFRSLSGELEKGGNGGDKEQVEELSREEERKLIAGRIK